MLWFLNPAERGCKNLKVVFVIVCVYSRSSKTICHEYSMEQLTGLCWVVRFLVCFQKPDVQWQNRAGDLVPAEEPRVSERGGSYDIILQTTVNKTDHYRCVATQKEIDPPDIYWDRCAPDAVSCILISRSLFFGVSTCFSFWTESFSCSKFDENSWTCWKCLKRVHQLYKVSKVQLLLSDMFTFSDLIITEVTVKCGVGPDNVTLRTVSLI